MPLHGNNSVRAISAKISDEEIALAKAYIQGAVHSHCNNCPDRNFSVCSLFGGDNRDWNGTPLQKIYDYHLKANHADPKKQAAIDVGRLLKAVLNGDVREFEPTENDTGWNYRYISCSISNG